MGYISIHNPTDSISPIVEDVDIEIEVSGYLRYYADCGELGEHTFEQEASEAYCNDDIEVETGINSLIINYVPLIETIKDENDMPSFIEALSEVLGHDEILEMLIENGEAA